MERSSRVSICPQNPLQVPGEKTININLRDGTASDKPFGGTGVADKDIRMLVEGVGDYLEWEKSRKAHAPHRSLIQDSLILLDFLRFAVRNEMAWEDMFALHTLKEFCRVSSFKYASRSLIALSSFLSIND